ncbi:MAG: hypothetical protein IKO74_01650 [Selenomonadaceae bacterium]|nr:hypothetical protein [Selenomonadaceae bacterium]
MTRRLITAYGDKAIIFGGTGHDSIYTSGAFVTINGGTGNDHIENKGKNAVFDYASGDGDDTIYGFDETSKIFGRNRRRRYYCHGRRKFDNFKIRRRKDNQH